jgi:hypothetical protein
MSNVVQFLLSAKDEVTPILNNLKGQFSALDNAVEGFQKGLGASLAFKGLDLAISQVGALQNAFWSAAQAQTQLIASSSDVGTNLGVSLGEARTTLEGLQGSIAKMAGALPGVTKDYNDTFVGFSSSLAKVFQGDTEGFKAAAEDMTKRAGVLAAIRQVSGVEAGSTLNRLLGGTMGFGEARQLDLLQKNPQLQDAIQQQAQARNLDISKLQKWSMQERYQVIAAALKVATPDSLINEFKGTAESIIQGWQTNLFDPLVGIFGVSRRVAERGQRSALDALTQFLSQLDILAQALGGVKLDPMRVLIDFLDDLSEATAALTSISQQGLSFDRIIEWTRGLDFAIVDGLNEGIAQFRSWLSRVDWIAFGKGIWDAVDEGFNHLARVLMTLDWGSIIKLLADGVVVSIEILLGVVKGIFTDLVDVVMKWVNDIKSKVNPVASVGGAVASSFNPIGQLGDIVQGGLRALPSIPNPLDLVTPKTEAKGSFQATINATPNEDPDRFAQRVAGVLQSAYQTAYQDSAVMV